MKRRTFSSEGCADAMVAAAYEDETEGDPQGNTVIAMQVEINELRAALRLTLPILEHTAQGKMCSMAAGDIAPTIRRILDGL